MANQLEKSWKKKANSHKENESPKDNVPVKQGLQIFSEMKTDAINEVEERKDLTVGYLLW